MPFLDSLDIANRACDHVGVPHILSPTEVSKRNTLISNCYDKIRRSELQTNSWRFAIKKTAIRAISLTTMIMAPRLWDANTLYLPGAVVADANGYIWSSTMAENLNFVPGQSLAWDQYFGPLTLDAYDTTGSIAYFSGELVYVPTGQGGFVIYQSLLTGNADVPSAATPWSATVQYGLDQVVTFGGIQWRSLIAVNLNNSPANGPANWNSAIAYVSPQVVVASDGYIYQAIASSTGIDPTTDNGTHWTNTHVPNAWSSNPIIWPSAQSWVALYASMLNLTINYPLGSGPSNQTFTRNIYRLPSGFLRSAPQDPKAGSVSFLGAPSGRRYDDWEFEGGNFMTTMESQPIVMRFVADVTNVQAMDDLFCEAIAARIAAEVCEALTQSNGKLQAIAGEYKGAIDRARTQNGIQEGPTEPPEDDYITCRV